MYHYIALAWHPADVSATREAHRLMEALELRAAVWIRTVHSEGLIVYSVEPLDSGMRAYHVPQRGGVILGRLFHSGTPTAPLDVAHLNAARIIKTSGRELLADYWGSYIAFLHSQDDDAVLVLRDCSGRLPCYYTTCAGLYVVFSDIHDITSLGLRFTIDHWYLASYILRHPLHITNTGLCEVTALMAGDYILLTSKQVTHRHIWNPVTLIDAPLLDDYTEAKSELVAATEHVICSWASVYNRILLSLSGGLDSAIVLGCIHRKGLADRIVCLNQYTECTQDDERQYARSAAKMAGVRLIERPRVNDAKTFVEKLQSVPPDPRPDFTKAARMLELDATNDLATEFDCDSVWTGQGGDHIFLQAHDSYAAADYLMQHLVPYRLPTILYESALLSGQSLWSVLAQALRFSFGIQSAPADPFGSCGATIMNPAFLRQMPADYDADPWQTSRSQLPPGKQLQIISFADLLHRHTPISGLERPYECHPLISQPLLELSLRIPTYHLLKGGRQRAMARDAFADRVPAQILNREDKGSVRDQARLLIRGSTAILREALLDGNLVSFGILDRASLEKIIVTRDTYRPAEVFALFGCIAAEIWTRHWSAHPNINSPRPADHR